MTFVEENLLAKVAQKTFRASLGKFGQNPLHPKNLPAPISMMKSHLHPRCPYFERSGGKDPRHASILRRVYAYYFTCTLFISYCRLQCATRPVTSLRHQGAKSFLRGDEFLNDVQ